MTVKDKELANLTFDEIIDSSRVSGNLPVARLFQEMKELYNWKEKTDASLRTYRSKLDKYDNDNVKRDNRINNIEEVTFTLKAKKKDRELSKYAKSKMFRLVGGGSTTDYIIFYHKFIRDCYSRLKSIYSVNSVGDIHIDNFNDCLKTVDNWSPRRNMLSKHLQDWVKKQDEGILPDYKSRALDRFLEKTEGGNKLPW